MRITLHLLDGWHVTYKPGETLYSTNINIHDQCIWTCYCFYVMANVLLFLWYCFYGIASLFVVLYHYCVFIAFMVLLLCYFVYVMFLCCCFYVVTSMMLLLCCCVYVVVYMLLFLCFCLCCCFYVVTSMLMNYSFLHMFWKIQINKNKVLENNWVYGISSEEHYLLLYRSVRCPRGFFHRMVFLVTTSKMIKSSQKINKLTSICPGSFDE